MTAKVEFLLAIFELDPPEGFSEDIGRLFTGRDEFNFNSVVFNFLASEMIVDFKVLHTLYSPLAS